MTTIYKLAITPDDLEKCHDALHLWGVMHPDRKIAQPCLMAFRDDRLVGFIGTAPVEEVHAVVCNRIAVDPLLSRTAHGFLVLRLVEGYERILRGAGVRWYHVPLDSFNETLIKIFERYGQKPYARVRREMSTSETVWFKREIA